MHLATPPDAQPSNLAECIRATEKISTTKIATLGTTSQVTFGWFPAKQTAVKKRTLAGEGVDDEKGLGVYEG